MTKVPLSVAEALGRAHAALLDDLRKLEEAIRGASREGLAQVRARLHSTRADIVEHFRFEEQNGFMEVVRKREPRLEHAIQQLADEHRDLIESLDGLVGRSELTSKMDEDFRAGIRAWIEQVRRHESKENELIQDTFNLDIGAED